MSNYPNRLLMSQARCIDSGDKDFEDISLVLDRRVGSLIENAPHLMVLRGRFPLLLAWTCPNPRGEMPLGAKATSAIVRAESTRRLDTSATRWTWTWWSHLELVNPLVYRRFHQTFGIAEIFLRPRRARFDSSSARGEFPRSEAEGCLRPGHDSAADRRESNAHKLADLVREQLGGKIPEFEKALEDFRYDFLPCPSSRAHFDLRALPASLSICAFQLSLING